MAEERKKWDPAKGTAAGLLAPTAVGLGIGVPTLAAISGSKSEVSKVDRPIVAHVKKAAKAAGAGVHTSKNPIPGMDILMPAYQWEHPPASGVSTEDLFDKPGLKNKVKDVRSLMKEAQREQGIEQIKSMTGSSAQKGIGMSKNIRPYMKPGILAHETGHALQPKWLKGAAYRAGGIVPGLAATYVAGTSDEKRAKTAATIGSLGAGGMLAAEFDASRRGAKLLKKAGMRGPRRLTSFAGLATYGAVAAAPWAAYAGKKAFGGYKPPKPTEKRLNAILDALIEFKEKKEQPPLSAGALRARQSMTASGALIGAYAGGLIGAERGSMASGLEGMKQSAEKFKQYAREDQARAQRKDFERYDVIEDRFGGQQKLLKGRERTIGSGEPFGARVKSAAGRFGKTAKEIPTRARYAAEDLAHGAGKWLTRSSLSRSIAIGAGVGTVAGRYLGTKFGRSLDQSNRRMSKERTQAKIRRQATEIAKARAMADSITKAMNTRTMNAMLDNLINFADPRPRNPLGEFQNQGEGGPDANSMATVYKQGQHSGIMEGGGAALLGGALGAGGAAAGKHGYEGLKNLASKIKANRKGRIVKP